jgi:hypothetical protein
MLMTIRAQTRRRTISLNALPSSIHATSAACWRTGGVRTEVRRTRRDGNQQARPEQLTELIALSWCCATLREWIPTTPQSSLGFHEARSRPGSIRPPRIANTLTAVAGDVMARLFCPRSSARRARLHIRPCSTRTIPDEPPRSSRLH